MSVFDKARELGLEIVDSKPFRAMQEAQAVVELDETANELTERFKQAQEDLRIAMESSDREQVFAARAHLFETDELMQQNETIAALRAAQAEMQNTINQINGILNYFITGDIESCSGSCAGCAGCGGLQN